MTEAEHCQLHGFCCCLTVRAAGVRVLRDGHAQTFHHQVVGTDLDVQADAQRDEHVFAVRRRFVVVVFGGGDGGLTWTCISTVCLWCCLALLVGFADWRRRLLGLIRVEVTVIDGEGFGGL